MRTPDARRGKAAQRCFAAAEVAFPCKGRGFEPGPRPKGAKLESEAYCICMSLHVGTTFKDSVPLAVGRRGWVVSAGRAPALGRSPTAGEVGSPPAGEMRGGKVKHQGLRRSGTLPNGASAFRGGGGVTCETCFAFSRFAFAAIPRPPLPSPSSFTSSPLPLFLSLCHPFSVFSPSPSFASTPVSCLRASAPLPPSFPSPRRSRAGGRPSQGRAAQPEQLIMTAPLRLGDLLLLSGGIPTPREGASRGGRAGQGRRPAD